jgi:hypothetical protein
MRQPPGRIAARLKDPLEEARAFRAVRSYGLESSINYRQMPITQAELLEAVTLIRYLLF